MELDSPSEGDEVMFGLPKEKASDAIEYRYRLTSTPTTVDSGAMFAATPSSPMDNVGVLDFSAVAHGSTQEGELLTQGKSWKFVLNRGMLALPPWRLNRQSISLARRLLHKQALWTKQRSRKRRRQRRWKQRT